MSKLHSIALLIALALLSVSSRAVETQSSERSSLRNPPPPPPPPPQPPLPPQQKIDGRKPPRTRPPKPIHEHPRPPNNVSISNDCKTAMQLLHNITFACSKNALSLSSAQKSTWCNSTIGCRQRLSNSTQDVLRVCKGSKGGPRPPQKHKQVGGGGFVAELEPSVADRWVGFKLDEFLNLERQMCQMPPGVTKQCKLEEKMLEFIGHSNILPTAMESLCTGCVVNRIAKNRRGQSENKRLEMIRKYRSKCLRHNGTYCAGELSTNSTFSFDNLCTPCKRRYYSQLAMESPNAYGMYRSLAKGACDRASSSGMKHCGQKVLDGIGGHPQNLTTWVSTHCPESLSSEPFNCTTTCRTQLTLLKTEVGACCSHAIPHTIRLLVPGANVTRVGCFSKDTGVDFGKPFGSNCGRRRKKKKLRIDLRKFERVPGTTDADICDAVVKDVAGSMGEDPDHFNCTVVSSVVSRGRRLLAVAQDIEVEVTMETTTELPAADEIDIFNLMAIDTSGNLEVGISEVSATTTTSTTAAPTEAASTSVPVNILDSESSTISLFSARELPSFFCLCLLSLCFFL